MQPQHHRGLTPALKWLGVAGSFLLAVTLGVLAGFLIGVIVGQIVSIVSNEHNEQKIGMSILIVLTGSLLGAVIGASLWGWSYLKRKRNAELRHQEK